MQIIAQLAHQIGLLLPWEAVYVIRELSNPIVIPAITAALPALEQAQLVRAAMDQL